MLMALYPPVQSKAQAELDALAGKGHVLQPLDLSQLEYLPAVMKEVLRYAPVANLGAPSKTDTPTSYR